MERGLGSSWVAIVGFSCMPSLLFQSVHLSFAVLCAAFPLLQEWAQVPLGHRQPLALHCQQSPLTLGPVASAGAASGAVGSGATPDHIACS